MAVTKAFVILLYTLLENIHETPLPLQTSQGHRTHRGQKQKGTKKKKHHHRNPGKFYSSMNLLTPSATLARETLMENL